VSKFQNSFELGNTFSSAYIRETEKVREMRSMRLVWDYGVLCKMVGTVKSKTVLET
jgi:hypothetical protein